jgi:hypothetical protein
MTHESGGAMIPLGESDRGGQPLSTTGAPSHARIVAELAQLENVGTRRSRVEAETLRWVLGHYPNSPMDDRRLRNRIPPLSDHPKGTS